MHELVVMTLVQPRAGTFSPLFFCWELCILTLASFILHSLAFYYHYRIETPVERCLLAFSLGYRLASSLAVSKANQGY